MATFLGEFEQMVLLAILQMGDQAFGLEVRREIERSTDRSVSRGAFYTTLDRLEQKGYVTWDEVPPTGERGGAPLRRFEVTGDGLEVLRASRRALFNLWRGLDQIMEDA
jgi:DNA-binding PadR family transcriptional regulator